MIEVPELNTASAKQLWMPSQTCNNPMSFIMTIPKVNFIWPRNTKCSSHPFMFGHIFYTNCTLKCTII
jgi:hypothetical protein